MALRSHLLNPELLEDAVLAKCAPQPHIPADLAHKDVSLKCARSINAGSINMHGPSSDWFLSVHILSTVCVEVPSEINRGTDNSTCRVSIYIYMPSERSLKV